MIRRILDFFRGPALDRQLDAEIAFHLDMETARHVQAGVPADEARRRAVRDFGGVVRAREATREERGLPWLETLVQDLRHGVRTLVHAPGYAAVAIVTLALGIGANTAMFSVIRGVLLKPLPYAHAERLVLLRQSAALAGQPDVGVSIKELYDYRDQARSFDQLVEFHQMSFDLLNQGEPDRVDTGVVSHNFFDTLGIAPALGRTFADADDDPGAPAVLVLSHSYWQSKFGGDPGVIGRVLEMNDRPHTVVGVLPAVPLYPREVDVYMPTSACPFRAAAERQIEANRRAFSGLLVFGRLAPAASPARAADEVATLGTRFAADFPAVYPSGNGFRATTLGVLEELTRNARPLLLLLVAITGLVLLLSCANVANLTLARMLRRDRELVMRSALGATRRRLIGQLLTESTVVALAGGALGLLFAYASLDLLAAFVGRFTPRTADIDIDRVVLAFTLSVAVATGLAFGTIPALASRTDLMGALKQGSLQGGEGSGRRRLRDALVVAQVAVSVVLLVGAGLMAVSFVRLSQVDPGYRGDRVLGAEVFGNFSRYPDAQSLRRLYEPILERLQAQPGVIAAAVTNAVPLGTVQPGRQPFEIEGQPVDDPSRRPSVDVRIASPDYFAVLGIPVLRGRTFTALDHDEAPAVVVVNQAMTRFWAGADPIGTRLSFDAGRTWATVVGVVGDVRQFGLDQEAIAQVYRPLAQAPGATGRVLLRATGDPVTVAATLRDAVRAVDPTVPIENVRTLDDLRDRALAGPRLTAALLGLFALLALVVTLTGLAGVIGTTVAQRTREFGVRMALGAARAQVLRMVLGHALALVTAGLLLGLALSVAAGRVLRGYLYATTPTDPWTLVAVAALLVAAGVVACLGPARRATTVDPLIALRTE